MKRLLLILAATSIIFPVFGFAANEEAKDKEIQAPQNLEEAKEMATKINWYDFPETIKKVWNQEVIPFYRNLIGLLKQPWNRYVWPKIERYWVDASAFLGFEIKKRAPEIKKEFDQESKEMQNEVPKAGESLWSKIKEIVR